MLRVAGQDWPAVPPSGPPTSTTSKQNMCYLSKRSRFYFWLRMSSCSSSPRSIYADNSMFLAYKKLWCEQVQSIPSPMHQRQFPVCCSSAGQRSQKEISPVPPKVSIKCKSNQVKENDSVVQPNIATAAPGARGTTGKGSSRSSLRLTSSSSKARSCAKPWQAKYIPENSFCPYNFFAG